MFSAIGTNQSTEVENGLRGSEERSTIFRHGHLVAGRLGMGRLHARTIRRLAFYAPKQFLFAKTNFF